MFLDRDGAEKLVREAAERHNVDPALVRAVIETESNWNPAATSRKGAVGLMQLIPTTAQRFGVNDAYNPQQNVDAGVRYLKTLLERYNGNLDLALAAYNAGEGAVDRAHGVPSYRETKNYVQKVQNGFGPHGKRLYPGKPDSPASGCERANHFHKRAVARIKMSGLGFSCEGVPGENDAGEKNFPQGFRRRFAGFYAAVGEPDSLPGSRCQRK
jgi:hypothetical protein